MRLGRSIGAQSFEHVLGDVADRWPNSDIEALVPWNFKSLG